MNAIKTHTITATGTDADYDTRYKNLAYSAATQMAEYLSTELPGFTLSGITYDSSSDYLPYRISLKNDKWGCELIVRANSRYHSRYYNHGLTFNYHIIVGDNDFAISDRIDYSIKTTNTGDTTTATFDLTVSSLESIAISVGIEYKDYDNYGYKTSVTLSSFTGSYSGDVFIGRGSSTSSVNMILPLDLSWMYRGGGIEYTFNSYSSSDTIYTKDTYYLRPYCWFPEFRSPNYGLSLFDNKYVLYVLALQGSDVSTAPGNKYIIDGEEHTAVTSYLIVPKPNPFRKVQKPGEVLTW